MGRKSLAPLRIEGKVTVQAAATLSSVASVGGRLTLSTSVDVDGAEILNVVSQPSIVTPTALTGAGGMAVIGSTSTLVYQLPTSTAGTLFYIYWSSGASAILSPADTTNTKIWGFPSTGKLATKVTGSTGDHALLIAQSSSQWNLLSHSSNVTSSS